MNLKTTGYPILVFVATVLFSCSGGSDQNPPMGFGPGAPKDYAVVKLSPRKAKVNLDYPATIQGQQVIEIRPKVDGYIDSI